MTRTTQKQKDLKTQESNSVKDSSPKSTDVVDEIPIQCNFTIDKSLRDDFKEIVYLTKGWEPGSMKKAFREAVSLWIEVNKENGRIE